MYVYIYIRYHSCIPMISQSSQNRLVPRVSLSTSSLRWRPVFCRFLRSSWASGWSWWKAAWQPLGNSWWKGSQKRHRGCDWVSCTCPMYPLYSWLIRFFLFQNRTGIPSLISMNHYPTVSNVAIENPPFLWCSQLSESIRGFSSFSSQPPKILPEGNLTENPININVKLKFKSLKLPLAFSVRLSSVQNPLLFNGLWSSPFMFVA